MTNLGDYHNFYLLNNVLLLIDMFENFRDVCLQYFGFDPTHNYTSPGFSWQAPLKMTNVELDLLTDFDQHMFINEGIRGGGNDHPPMHSIQRPWHAKLQCQQTQ